MEVVLERDGDAKLRFVGEFVAQATSRAVNAPRWTDHELYRTNGGKYVLATIGRTDRADERERHAAFVCATPVDVREALRRGNGRLTNVAKALLTAAEVHDPAFLDVLVEDLT